MNERRIRRDIKQENKGNRLRTMKRNRKKIRRGVRRELEMKSKHMKRGAKIRKDKRG